MTIHRYTKVISWYIAGLVLLLVLQPVDAYPMQRARQEYISINTDVYELSVAVNGTASIHTLEGMAIFAGAGPRVLYAGEERFRRLNTDARNSMRRQVNDFMGQGQGLSFFSRNGEWRLNTYPAQPYFSVRLAYHNSGRRPVRIAALSPWYVSDSENGRITLGDGSAQTVFLSEGDAPGRYDGLRFRDDSGAGRAMLAMWNPVSGQVLTSGFLTQERSETYLHGARDNHAAADREISRFIAVCIFDPPVTVAPGDTLEAEALYISVGDAGMFSGLNTLTGAVAAAHGLQPRRPALGSGLQVGGRNYNNAFSLREIVEAVSFQKTHLSGWGWNHLTLGAGWETAVGEWTPDQERFPGGFTAINEVVHEAGFSAAIRVQPFLLARDSEVARAHPDWLLHYPDEEGNGINALDVSRPDVRAWLTNLAATLTNTHGFQTLIAEDTDCLFKTELPDDFGMTRIQLYRMGLQALRDGLAADKQLIVVPWHPAAITATDVIARDSKSVSAAELGLFPSGNPLLLGKESCIALSGLDNSLDSNRAKSTTAIITAAMTGSSLLVTDRPDMLSDWALTLLRRTWPPLSSTGFPYEISLEQDYARYHQFIRTRAGQWHLVALLNRSDSDTVVAPLALEEPHAGPRTPYTLYEFVTGNYHGLMNDAGNISLPPGAVRFFGLRPFENRPMLLASERHLGQGALDHREINWDAETQQLTGVFRADPVTYQLRFLAPPPWELLEAHVSSGSSEVNHVGDDTIILDFSCDTRQTVHWTLRFAETDAVQGVS